jgi:ATP-dependent Clp protease ATP-binding subunit ClpA
LYRNESWKPTSLSSKFNAALPLAARSFSSQPPGGRIPGQPWVNPDNEVPGKNLEQFSVDLTKMAQENKLDPVIGRHEEIRRTLQILARRTKNNPVLIGKPCMRVVSETTLCAGKPSSLTTIIYDHRR